jgi:hypothetical protein
VSSSSCSSEAHSSCIRSPSHAFTRPARRPSLAVAVAAPEGEIVWGAIGLLDIVVTDRCATHQRRTRPPLCPAGVHILEAPPPVSLDTPNGFGGVSGITVGRHMGGPWPGPTAHGHFLQQARYSESRVVGMATEIFPSENSSSNPRRKKFLTKSHEHLWRAFFLICKFNGPRGK